ncbi:aldo-keto reductase family 1 member A1 isoform X1 [Solenopsis invicta]|uniref:aldo-keto reductase family 1 member A1 isoform X1 n=1 Tax=Solenopsis invicta TaxID=13686 RepID=UPI0005958860|nr:aldo-keto reductase family 1 member A1 isoform X1 [Solenopsis invicta]XP_025990871.1 aldo-keto reductase family 1 member A1 isoform X1 [Solenopsis invicta]XP_039308863.1 aldo-keto reductase family 1 member A1 isoform X1 [Solenopsis invicta]
MHSVRLLSGYDMPTVGLGTWQAKPEEIETVVSTALQCGYRHIDTAANYNNEDAIGRALKKWFDKGGTREELFITTKLPHFGNRPSDVEKFIKLSLKKLGLEYLDMYLIHMPFAFKLDENTCTAATNKDGSYIFDFNTDPVSVWKEMEKQVELGRTRSIGLSNFNEQQISTIWENAQIKPSNLQVELHAYMQQTSIRELCKKHNVVVTGYSPLGSPAAKTHFKTKYDYTSESFPDLLNHPIIQNIAAQHKKTVAQVLLRHLLQLGVVIIPKSSSPERIKSNIDLFNFALTEENMKILSTLDKGAKGRIFNFLFFKGIQDHPHYPFKNELP